MSPFLKAKDDLKRINSINAGVQFCYFEKNSSDQFLSLTELISRTSSFKKLFIVKASIRDLGESTQFSQYLINFCQHYYSAVGGDLIKNPVDKNPEDFAKNPVMFFFLKKY